MIYVYRCTECSKETELIATIANRDNVRKCEECGAFLKRIEIPKTEDYIHKMHQWVRNF